MEIRQYALTFLLNSLWQAPLAAGVALLAGRLLSNGPARHRHAVCVAGLAATLLLPALSTRRPAMEATVAVAQPIGPALAQYSPAPSTAAAAAPSGTRRSVPLPRDAATIVLAGYALFLSFGVARLLFVAVKTVAIRRAAGPAAPGPMLARVWTACAEAFRLRSVKLRSSRTISGPVTAGGAIILPERMMAETSEPLLTTAIGHEMGHLARRDFACNILYELLYLPLSFHPAMRYLRREIERTRELACDELVTSRLIEPAAYAESIVSIAASMSALRQPGYSLGVFDGDILEERIKRLIDRPASNLKRARLLLVAAFSALAICAVIASGLAVSARAQSAAQPEMRIGAAALNHGAPFAAVEHFQKAVAADPSNDNARLHLANALIRAYQRDATKSPDESIEQPLLRQARDQYAAILAHDPHNERAVFGLVSVNGPARSSESRDLMMKLIAADGKNAKAYYAVGTLDWQIVYPPIREAQQAARIFPQKWHIPDAAVRAQLSGRLMPNIEEGLRVLQIALSLDPHDDGAMAYMNLLGRTKAALVDSVEESDALIAQADAWVGKALGELASRGRSPRSPRTIEPVDPDAPPPLAVPAIPPPPPPPPPGAGPGNPRERAGIPPPPPSAAEVVGGRLRA